MNLIQNQLVIKNEDFNEFLDNYFGEEYGLGIHGIDNSECWIKKDGEWQLDTQTIEKIKNSILNEGLYIKGNRTLLSTVSFGQIDNYLTRGYYEAGGIVIALPKTIKNCNGEHYFVGYPIENADMIDRNYTFTSLSDMILPEFFEDYGLLNPMFILAKYEKIGDKEVKFTINPNHIYFNGGLLPNEYFDVKKKTIINICNSYGVSNLEELMDNVYYEILQKDTLFPSDKAVVNTVNQFYNISKKVK